MYGKILSAFWTDAGVRKLSHDGRHLLLYLLTCPHRNLIGLFYLPDAYTSADLQWSMSRVTGAFTELERHDFARVDPSTNVVLVSDYLRHNPLENPNQVKAAAKRLEALPDTFLLSELAPRLTNESLALALHERLVKGSRTLSERFGNGSGTVAEQETVKVTVKEPATVSEATCVAGGRSGFDSFWQVYPKKVGKGAAETAWRKLKPSDELQRSMIATIETAKNSDQWQRDGGQYIPNPATWLNQRRWLDETPATSATPRRPWAVQRVETEEDDDKFYAEMEALTRRRLGNDRSSEVSPDR